MPATVLCGLHHGCLSGDACSNAGKCTGLDALAAQTVKQPAPALQQPAVTDFVPSFDALRRGVEKTWPKVFL